MVDHWLCNMPILNYGSEVWGLLESTQLERAHIRYCKELLCVRQHTQNNFIYGELGRTTLLSFRSYVIKYWWKIVHMKCTKYVKIVYNLLYNDIDVNNNTRSWVMLVRELLQYLGFNHVWMQQNVGDDNMFLKDVK